MICLSVEVKRAVAQEGPKINIRPKESMWLSSSIYKMLMRDKGKNKLVWQQARPFRKDTVVTKNECKTFQVRWEKNWLISSPSDAVMKRLDPSDGSGHEYPTRLFIFQDRFVYSSKDKSSTTARNISISSSMRHLKEKRGEQMKMTCEKKNPKQMLWWCCRWNLTGEMLWQMHEQHHTHAATV